MAFDPDKYIAQKSQRFNPDAYLAQKLGGTTLASVSSPADGTATDPSIEESLLRGAAQGATLGWAPQIAGGAEALGDLISGSDKGKSLMDLYRQHRDESKANFKKAEDTNPIASTVGNIGGGLVPGILSGGLGEVAEAPGLLAKVGQAAKVGGIAGGIAGLGSSDADLTQGQLGQGLKDATSGAVTGAVTGGALQGAGSLAGGLIKNTIGQTRLGQDLGAAFGMGKEGTNLLSHKGIRNIVDNERSSAAQDITSEILGLKGVLGGQYDKIAKDFGDGNINVKDATSKIQSLIDGLNDKIPAQAKDKAILQQLLDGSTKENVQAQAFTPATSKTSEAVPSARDILKAKLDKLNAANNFEGGTSSAGNAAEAGQPVGATPFNIQNVPGEGDKNYLGIFNKDKGLMGMPVEDTPGSPAVTTNTPAIPGDMYNSGTTPVNDLNYSGAKDLKQGFKDLSGYGKEMSSTPGTNAATKATGILGDTLDAQVPGSEDADDMYHNFSENVLDKLGIKGNIQNNDIDGATAKLSRLIFNGDADTGIGTTSRGKISEAMEALQQINPEAANNIQHIQETASNRIRIARAANNESFPTAPNALSDVKGLVGIKLANGLGQASRTLSDMPKEGLANLGNQLMTSNHPLAPQLGKILVQASDRDQIGRNALIFTLMQNESYRQLLTGLHSQGQ